MKVSVVVPVYNASRYVREAVDSVLQQSEVGEIILVEDGSRDNSLDVCRAISAANPRVKLITHPDNQNRGASVSRNVGIDAATMPYVAFLDADDFYLPNRFVQTKRLFSCNKNTHVIFESIGTHYENDEARRQYETIRGPITTGMHEEVPQDKVFESMQPLGRYGHCSLVGLTMRRDAIPNGLRFDVGLPIGEDTAFILKLAASLKVAIGDRSNIVAKRRVHASNHFASYAGSERRWRLQLQLWLSVYRWLARNPSQQRHREILLNKMIWQAANSYMPETRPSMAGVRIFLPRILQAIAAEPRLLTERRFLIRSLRQGLAS